MTVFLTLIQQDCSPAPQGECFDDAWVDGNTVFPGKRSADIFFVDLIQIDRCQVHLRLQHAMACGKPLDQLGEDHFGMGSSETGGEYRSDLLASVY